MTTHYRHGDTSACTARIKPPSLTRVRLVDCGTASGPTHTGTPCAAARADRDQAAAADVPVLTEWLERLAS